jgi:hypothetical protein
MRVPRSALAVVSGAAIAVVVMQTGVVPSAGARPAVAGPGSVTRLYLFRNTTGAAATVNVGGYSYQPTCTVTGRGANRTAESFLKIKPLAGQTYEVYGPVLYETGTPGTISKTVTDSFHHRTGETDFFVPVSAGKTARLYFSISLVGNDSSFQQLTFRMSTTAGAIAQYEARCMLEGEVVPTAA